MKAPPEAKHTLVGFILRKKIAKNIHISFKRKIEKVSVYTRNAQKPRSTTHVRGKSNPRLEERDNSCLSRTTTWRGYERKIQKLITKIAVQNYPQQEKGLESLRDVIRLLMSSPNLARNAGVDVARKSSTIDFQTCR